MSFKLILAAGAIALGSTCVCAEPLRPTFSGGLPPAEIDAIVRSMGLMPTGRPVREGLTYGVLATDARGRAVRVIVDARFGDVLAVRRVVAGPPGTAPEPRAYSLRAYPPYRMPWMGPEFRPPGLIGHVPPSAPPAAQPKPPATAKAANTATRSVTIGTANAAGAAAGGADPKPTGSTAKAQSFPPVQAFE